MIMPTSVQILGKWIKVIYKPEIKDGKEDLHGYYETSSKTIVIGLDQSEEEMMVTLIHEMGHCLVDLTSHTETFTRKQEETMCRIIENFSDFFYLKPSSSKIRYRKQKDEDHSQ